MVDWGVGKMSKLIAGEGGFVASGVRRAGSHHPRLQRLQRRDDDAAPGDVQQPPRGPPPAAPHEPASQNHQNV